MLSCACVNKINIFHVQVGSNVFDLNLHLPYIDGMMKFVRLHIHRFCKRRYLPRILRGQNAEYGNGAPKLILKCLNKAHLGAPKILKFLCLCSGTHSVVAYLTILVRF